eukprot:TRINITY_DN18509_c0_g2_i1.p1 TRINITY_DN18509_c0_g2~~TRINITY_DN18509_c0_g2_i1.p1  ORF type:complete len:661 (+),score=93.19 TRINITY_DN18509_c0_g2_i1:55-2037(+)
MECTVAFLGRPDELVILDENATVGCLRAAFAEVVGVPPANIDMRSTEDVLLDDNEEPLMSAVDLGGRVEAAFTGAYAARAALQVAGDLSTSYEADDASAVSAHLRGVLLEKERLGDAEGLGLVLAAELVADEDVLAELTQRMIEEQGRRRRRETGEGLNLCTFVALAEALGRAPVIEDSEIIRIGKVGKAVVLLKKANEMRHLDALKALVKVDLIKQTCMTKYYGGEECLLNAVGQPWVEGAAVYLAAGWPVNYLDRISQDSCMTLAFPKQPAAPGSPPWTGLRSVGPETDAMLRLLVSYGAEAVHTVRYAGLRGLSPILEKLASSLDGVGPVADLRAADLFGRNVLHYAAECGQTHLVALAVERSVDVNAQDNAGHTPLHYAARHGNPDTAAALLACNGGAQHSVIRPGLLDKEGATVLHWACRHRQPEAARVLCSDERVRRQIDARDKKFGRTALEWAILANDAGSVAWLLQEGAAVGDAAALAASTGNADVLHAVVEHAGDACIDTLNRAGQSALYQATMSGSTDAIKYLLRRGANASMRNTTGETPLHEAVRSRCWEAAEILLEAPSVQVDAQAQCGSTPLHAAVYPVVHARFAALLLRYGADPSLCDCQGRSAAAVAAESPALAQVLSDPQAELPGSDCDTDRSSGDAESIGELW